MEDAVGVANGLHDAVRAHPNKKPADAEVRDVLRDSLPRQDSLSTAEAQRRMGEQDEE